MISLNRAWISRSLMLIWLCNCLLASIIAVRQVWIPYMDAGSDGYTKIISDPFDGTTMPIAYIPDWTKSVNQDKSKRFESIPISEYLPIPQYDPLAVLNAGNQTKSDIILRYTYITQYMGNYKLDYKEHAGGHPAADIRAPIGTPVLSIANGVIVRTVEADAIGTKFVVVRHDNVMVRGRKTTLYSSYLHLSEISATEGSKVRKGEMIGRVGMTGMATTPHLHFQIDTSDAPFHPYWPYTSADAKAAGVDFYTAINIGLGKEKAVLYTINPMEFVNQNLGGAHNQLETVINLPSQNSLVQDIIQSDLIFPSAPPNPTENIAPPATVTPADTKTTIASYVGRSAQECRNARFLDVPEKSALGKMLYPLVDSKCLFQEADMNFESKTSVTVREAITNIMKYYDVKPKSGTSHFLDIAIGDNFQGYALVAYQKGLLSGNYAHPDRILTKDEFVELLVKIGRIEKNPSNIQVYSDVTPMNPRYNAIQDYAFLVGSHRGKFAPASLMTRATMTQILKNIPQKK